MPTLKIQVQAYFPIDGSTQYPSAHDFRSPPNQKCTAGRLWSSTVCKFYKVQQRLVQWKLRVLTPSFGISENKWYYVSVVAAVIEVIAISLKDYYCSLKRIATDRHPLDSHCNAHVALDKYTSTTVTGPINTFDKLTSSHSASSDS
jgi:hypothetical protein